MRRGFPLPGITTLRLLVVWVIALAMVVGRVGAASEPSSSLVNTYPVLAIPDNGPWVASSVSVSGAPQGAIVTSVDAFFSAVHPRAGDLRVYLTTSAQGGLPGVTLWNREGGYTGNPSRTVTSQKQRSRGFESSR